MQKISFLNREFFDKLIGAYYPVFGNIYLYIAESSYRYYKFKRDNLYKGYFCVLVNGDFYNVFSVDIIVSFRKIQICRLEYCLESEFVCANIKSFPLSPAWLLPCTNYLQFFNRCIMSLRVYRKRDLI